MDREALARKVEADLKAMEYESENPTAPTFSQKAGGSRGSRGNRRQDARQAESVGGTSEPVGLASLPGPPEDLDLLREDMDAWDTAPRTAADGPGPGPASDAYHRSDRTDAAGARPVSVSGSSPTERGKRTKAPRGERVSRGARSFFTKVCWGFFLGATLTLPPIVVGGLRYLALGSGSFEQVSQSRDDAPALFETFGEIAERGLDKLLEYSPVKKE
jgi:hypothetical protein